VALTLVTLLAVTFEPLKVTPRPVPLTKFVPVIVTDMFVAPWGRLFGDILVTVGEGPSVSRTEK